MLIINNHYFVSIFYISGIFNANVDYQMIKKRSIATSNHE